MNSVKVENLKKYYGAVHALDGLDLDVAPGTVFGFLGPERGRQDHHPAHPDRAGTSRPAAAHRWRAWTSSKTGKNSPPHRPPAGRTGLLSLDDAA